MKKTPNPFRKMTSYATYRYIAEQFLKREPVDKRAYKRVSRPSGEGSFQYGSDNSWRGGPRVYTSDDGRALYSYGTHFVLAEWIGEHLIVNADPAPSTDTRHHQRLLNLEIDAQKVPYGEVPYALLKKKNIHADAVTVLIAATTTERAWTWKRKCRRPKYCGPCYQNKAARGFHVITDTFQTPGETVFMERRGSSVRYYVTGIDLNDDPWRRTYYVGRLSVKAPPASVNEAIRAMRPSVSEQARRMGRVFFDPVTDRATLRQLKKAPARALVPLVSDEPAVQREQFTHRQIEREQPMPVVEQTLLGRINERGDVLRTDFWSRRDESKEMGARRRAVRGYRLHNYNYGRRVASREVVLDSGVYVRGVVRDTKHTALDLGERWHRVVWHRDAP